MISQLVIFGATGDLTSRLLLPALAELAAKGLLPADFVLTGSAAVTMDTAGFRDHGARALAEHGGDQPSSARDWIVDRMHFVPADATDPEALAAVIGTGQTPIACHLALPTGVIPGVLEGLAMIGLPAGSRIAVEKPFGDDLDGAKSLADLIGRLFGDDADETIFTVDHALGMGPVQALLPLRFANRFPGALWSGEHIAEVRVLWEESMALEGRAAYYDRSGALKDVMQNHMMQVLAMATIEQPDPPGAESPGTDSSGTEASGPSKVDAAALRKRKTELLGAVVRPSIEEAARRSRRGRYTAGTLADDPDGGGRRVPSYVDEDGVDPSRATETFAEVSFEIDSPRWQGTRFRLRAGKALSARRKGIEVIFRPVVGNAMGQRLWFGVDGPNDMECDLVAASTPGQQADTSVMGVRGPQPEADLNPYAHVLKNILDGGSQIAAGIEESELAWKILTPFLEAWDRGLVEMEDYPAGGTGPGGTVGRSASARTHEDEKEQRV